MMFWSWFFYVLGLSGAVALGAFLGFRIEQAVQRWCDGRDSHEDKN